MSPGGHDLAASVIDRWGPRTSPSQMESYRGNQGERDELDLKMCVCLKLPCLNRQAYLVCRMLSCCLDLYRLLIYT